MELLHHIHHGNHLVLLYTNTFELLDVVANYLKAGIDQDECCILYVADKLAEEAIDSLTEKGMDVSGLMLTSQLQIISCNRLSSGEWEDFAVETGEIKKAHEKAMSSGYVGLRVAFCPVSAIKEKWPGFLSHERNLSRMLRDTGSILLRAFSQASLSGSQMLDVLGMYDKVIIKRNEKWSILNIGLSDAACTEKLDLYGRMLDRIWTGVWIIDRDDHVIFFNPGMEAISGLFRGQVLGNDLLDYVKEMVPDAYEAFLDLFNKAKNTRKPIPYDFLPFVKPEEGLLYQSGVLYPLFDSTGEYDGMVGTVEDITERKKAEEALLVAEEKYRLIFENSPLGIFHFDEKGTITHCNERFLKIVDTTRDKLIGFNIVTSLKDEKMAEAVRAVFSRKLGHYEGEYRSVISGKVTSIKADYSPNISHDSSLLGGIGIFEDITERKKVEAALKLDELRLQALLELNQMTGASLKEITDFALEAGVRLTQSKVGYLSFLSADEKVLIMHSWSRVAMKICRIRDKPIEYPLENTGLWGEAVRQRKPIVNNDYKAPNPLKKGYPKGHVELTCHMNVPIFDGNRIVIVAGVGNKEEDYDESDVRQLTLLMEGMWRQVQRKRAEDSLMKYAEDLARANEELSKANEELKSLDRMKDEFLSNVSHEFKTPLTSIKGYSQLILDGTLGDINDQQKKAMDTVIRNSDRLRRLVDSLLYLSRAQVGRMSYYFEKLQLADLINNCIHDQLLQAKSKGVVLRTEIEAIPPVRADKDKLTDVLTNLIDNALKFTSEGGQIIVAAKKVPNGVQLEVRDTGIGIPADQIPHLFQRFYQVDSSASRRYGGTGLGLYISKTIVEAHEGKIWIESEEGRGTTVHVELPHWSE